MSRLRDFTMKSKIKFISLQAIFVFGLVEAVQPQTGDLHAYPVDVSIYDGQGSLLIEWSYPDTILANQVRIFVQESGQFDFELLTVLTLDQDIYLDLRCEPNARYFYKIEIEDTFGTVFTSDTKTPAFGTCLTIEDSLAFDPKIGTVQDLVLSQILGQALSTDLYGNFQPIVDLLKLTKRVKYIWFENYPIELLKTAEQSLQIIEEIIPSSELIDKVLAHESIYRNHFLMNPDIWQSEVEKAVAAIRGQWNLLYSEYPKAIEMLETTAPIRIIGYKITEENQKELELYIFHPNQISSSELFLLSGDEYVNLGVYQNEHEPMFKVIVPNHWITVDLMMDDIFIQTCPLIFDESIYFTLNGDFIPKDDQMIMRVGLSETSLWLNELTWNPYTKNLHLEVAGNPEYEDQYSFVLKGEIIWDLETFPGFEIQYQDSSLMLEVEIEYPILISFMKNEGEETSTLEYILLDTLPVAISRMPDGGPWHYTESTTLGITNKPIKDSFETDLLPELFVLYQNYPNPFNGQTRITFDLLEDATVSLYITDATGRIHDKFMENEFITSGNYNYNWNGEGRSTGIYFFTIQAQVDQRPPAIFSRKMIYLK